MSVFRVPGRISEPARLSLSIRQSPVELFFSFPVLPHASVAGADAARRLRERRDLMICTTPAQVHILCNTGGQDPYLYRMFISPEERSVGGLAYDADGYTLIYETHRHVELG